MTEASRMSTIRARLARRSAQHRERLAQEATRLAAAAAALGVRRLLLFGSAARGSPGLASDLDLLLVWDTPLDFLSRTVELYRRLQPRVAVDMLAYTPEEMETMADRPFVRRALQEGRVLYEAGAGR